MGRRYEYDKAVAALTDILIRGLKSIRQEHFSRRKLFAYRLHLPVQSVINLERGHRKLLAAELMLLSYAMNKDPQWVLEEIMRRFESEIYDWRKQFGFPPIIKE